MRNVCCSKYDVCLASAAKENAPELPCATCADGDEVEQEVCYDPVCVCALIEAIYTLTKRMSL